MGVLLMKPCALYSYTCLIENVFREPGLQWETLWSLNSFTQEQYSRPTRDVCDMIQSSMSPFIRSWSHLNVCFKAPPFGTSVCFALLRLLALCYQRAPDNLFKFSESAVGGIHVRTHPPCSPVPSVSASAIAPCNRNVWLKCYLC